MLWRRRWGRVWGKGGGEGCVGTAARLSTLFLLSCAPVEPSWFPSCVKSRVLNTARLLHSLSCVPAPPDCLRCLKRDRLSRTFCSLCPECPSRFLYPMYTHVSFKIRFRGHLFSDAAFALFSLWRGRTSFCASAALRTRPLWGCDYPLSCPPPSPCMEPLDSEKQSRFQLSLAGTGPEGDSSISNCCLERH